jgi:hypothetical protein
MMRAERGLERELVSFLEHRRIARTVPPEMRGRVLAAAKAVSAAGGVVPAALAAERRSTPAASSTSFGRGRAPLRIALAASVAVAAAAVGAAAALQARRDQAPPPSAGPSVPAAAPSGPMRRASSHAPSEAPLEAAPAVAISAPAEKSIRPRRLASRVDPFAGELDLLQRAHAAYTRRDFSTALTLVSEHARRFPKGNLAEQREALRVRSLAGAGRGDDAHRAAAGFAHRFPRSVLLPRIEDSAESPVP